MARIPPNNKPARGRRHSSFRALMLSLAMAIACCTPGAVAVAADLPSHTGLPAAAERVETGKHGAGRELWLETIELNGNNHTAPAIVQRHLMLAPGDAVDVGILEAGRQRLLATGYFKSVEFSTRPGTERGAVVLVIDMVERGPASFETGFGYDDLYGWFLTLLGVRFDNLFGVESQFRLGLRLGFRLAGVDGEWSRSAPPGGGYGYAIKGWIYNQRQSLYALDPRAGAPLLDPRWERFDQDISRAGAEFALRYYPGGVGHFSFGVKAESNDPDSVVTRFDTSEDYGPDDFPESIRRDLGRHEITGFFLRAIRDTRDSGDYPQSGSFGLFTLELNNTLLGGDYIFAKAVGDYRTHLSLGSKRVISVRARGGLISGDAPYYARFYLGGNYTIRGFREWSLSPAGGDGRFWLVNAELRAPLIDSRRAQPRLTGLVFFDAGQGWSRGDDYSINNVESAVGYGVRLRLPWLGTLGADAGVPVSEGRTGDEFWIHLLLGFSF